LNLGVRASGGKGGAESGGEEEELLQLGIRRPDAEHLHFFPAAEERRGRDVLGAEQAAVRALVEKGPWTEVEEGGGRNPAKSGELPRRRPGERGGGARGDRTLPVCALGRGWRRPERGRPRREAGGGDGKPRQRCTGGLGGGERVGELRRGTRKVAGGSIGGEEGRGRELSGEIELGGGNG